MKIFAKTVLIAASLLLSAATGFAADAKATAKTAGDTVKTDTKAPAPAAKESSGANAATAKAQEKGALVDINSATAAELKGVPGIGEAYAAKIIAGRPYANKAQLKSRNIVPGNVYEQVKDKIIAKQKK
jgi:competence protein ComEA